MTNEQIQAFGKAVNFVVDVQRYLHRESYNVMLTMFETKMCTDALKNEVGPGDTAYKIADARHKQNKNLRRYQSD